MQHFHLCFPQKAKEKLSNHEELYIQTVQVCRQILPLVDVQTQNELKAEIGALQEAWEQSNSLVVKRKALSETVIQVCIQNPTLRSSS